MGQLGFFDADKRLATISAKGDPREIVSVPMQHNSREENEAVWPAPGSEDTELGVLMEPEVHHGAAEVYTRV